MKAFRKSLTPEDVQRIIGGKLVLKTPTVLKAIADPREADLNSIVFLDNEKFLPMIVGLKVGLIIAGQQFQDALSGHESNLIFTNNAYQSVLILIHFWLESEKGEFVSRIHPTAQIGNNVSLSEKIIIEAYAVIGDNVTIGDFSIIGSHSNIGSNVMIGSNCQLFPNTVIYDDTEIGNNVRIHAGSVIGSDGFGYLLLDDKQQKIPQVGNVVIHDQVEIGANTTIDRGTIGSTIIGEGTKIDNLVQIGHNCIIGKHCIVCAQVGLAGSSNVGDYVYLAGQVGLAGHLTVEDRVMVGAQSGVSNNLKSGKKYFGYPAREAMQMKKIMAIENNLPEIYKYIQKLKKERG